MKRFKLSPYISHRIGMLFLASVIISLLDIGRKISNVLQGKDPLISLIASILILIVYLSVSWYHVYLPYQKTERMILRFLNGFALADYADMDIAQLSPSAEKELLKLHEMMHSPEIFDLNKRQAQYLALQNQINPHFLYNTLESIRSEAVIAQLDSVADMTESLAAFFRYTISNVENLVSVEDELENCKNYFHIQEYRFGDRLQLHVDCDAQDWQSIRYFRLPKLTLQPILENSIIHGTELKLGTGNLRIAFEYTQTRLLIRISDDGVGMNREQLFALNQRLNRTQATKNTRKKGGIALENVNNRIHLLFGEQYGMHVYSVEGLGTDVEITLPAITSDREVTNRSVLTNEAQP